MMETTKTYETGHAKNVANFRTLTSFVAAYGEIYNPSNEAIYLTGINTLADESQAGVKGADIARIAYIRATNDRAEAFEPLKSTATRLMAAIKVSGATDSTIEDAKSINKKIQGVRATKPQDGTRTLSVSRQSFDSLTENFSRFIEILSVEPSYKPNEEPLKINSLKTFLAGLRQQNQTVIDAYTAYSNAKIARDRLLYAPKTGLIDIALNVKEYVKSIFGTSSPEYRQISGLEFKRIQN